MILSGRDVRWYLEVGALKITPALTEEQFQQNGVDMILEDVEFRSGPIFPRDENRNRPPFRPGGFYLGSTRERLEMPNDLMAFVELRSSWARSGLLLPPTIVDAGFQGNLTLEIASFANVAVPIGQRFAHLIFAKLTSPSEPYRGKYHNQSGITLAKEDKR